MTSMAMNSSPFIALNSTCKQKQDKANVLSNNMVLLLKTFERSITILTQALVKV